MGNPSLSEENLSGTVEALLPDEKDSGLGYTRFVLRADAGREIGFGHLIRLATLGRALRAHGLEVDFVGPPRQASHFLPLLEGLTLVPRLWQGSSDEGRWLAQYLRSFSSERCHLIVDDYRVDNQFREALLEGHVKWSEFQPTPTETVWPDWVVSTGPQYNPATRAERLGAMQRGQLLGTSFSVIRPELLALRKASKSFELNRLVVLGGGGDDRGLIKLVLRSLKRLPATELTVDVVVGPSNPSFFEIEKLVEKAPDRFTIHVHEAPANYADLMAASDLAISAGGTTTFELATLGIPMLLIAISSNQISQCLGWERLGAARYLGFITTLSEQSFPDSIRDVFQDASLRRSLSKKAERLVDGRGAERLAKILVTAPTKLSFARDDGFN